LKYFYNMERFIFGTFIYEYKLIKQDRKTLSLTVTPELKLVLKCPKQVNKERIEKFLRKKWFWLEKQLSYFKKYQHKLYQREYISGESHLYLGRQYKLIVKQGKSSSVMLNKGQLILFTDKLVSNSIHNKKLLTSWFEKRVNHIFQERFIEVLSKFNYKKEPKLYIREMSKRWGSFLNQDKIFLNPKLIHAGKECIDYVIVHELCHMKYKKHDNKFYNLLKQKHPRWEKVKSKLEVVGSMIY